MLGRATRQSKHRPAVDRPSGQSPSASVSLSEYHLPHHRLPPSLPPSLPHSLPLSLPHSLPHPQCNNSRRCGACCRATDSCPSVCTLQVISALAVLTCPSLLAMHNPSPPLQATSTYAHTFDFTRTHILCFPPPSRLYDVCAESQERVLHVPVCPVWLDAPLSPHHRLLVSPHDAQHLRGPHLVCFCLLFLSCVCVCVCGCVRVCACVCVFCACLYACVCASPSPHPNWS